VARARKSAKLRHFMLSDDELEGARRVAAEVAREAGAIIMQGWRSGGAVSKKGRFDLLTEFDLASEALIRERLGAAFPSHRIVGEEGDDTGAGDLVWYVDPIDGTTNFAHGHFFFAVSMGLYDGVTGLVGAVYAPALDILWTAARGKGAFRNETPCHVSSRATLDEAMCATGFPYDRWSTADDNHAELRAFLKRARGIRRCGAAAMDLCLVADGTYDVYWEKALNAWDMCAGALLVEEAGGRTSGYDGEPADPRSGKLVATNGLLHEATLETIREARHKLGLGDP
jgi:myo-inositol-1(or 4)-monophosphatase